MTTPAPLLALRRRLRHRAWRQRGDPRSRRARAPQCDVRDGGGAELDAPSEIAASERGGRARAIGLHLTLTGPFKPLSANYAPLATARSIRRDDAAPCDAAPSRPRGARARGRRANRGIHRKPSAARRISSTATSTCTCFRRCATRCSTARERLAPERLGAPVRPACLPLPGALNDPKGLLIDWLSRAFRARAADLGVRDQPGLRRHLYLSAGRRLSRRCFRGFLDGLPEGGVVMCHPGHVDADLERLDPLTTIREREYAYLCGDAFPAAAENPRPDAELKPYAAATTFHVRAIPAGVCRAPYQARPNRGPRRNDDDAAGTPAHRRAVPSPGIAGDNRRAIRTPRR